MKLYHAIKIVLDHNDRFIPDHFNILTKNLIGNEKKGSIELFFQVIGICDNYFRQSLLIFSHSDQVKEYAYYLAKKLKEIYSLNVQDFVIDREVKKGVEREVKEKLDELHIYYKKVIADQSVAFSQALGQHTPQATTDDAPKAPPRKVGREKKPDELINELERLSKLCSKDTCKVIEEIIRLSDDKDSNGKPRHGWEVVEKDEKVNSNFTGNARFNMKKISISYKNINAILSNLSI